MPRQVPALADELVLRELDHLSPSICITAAQAGMVLGVTVSWLEERRRAGQPPPFIADGDVRGKVRYPIGALREHIRAHTHQSGAAARQHSQRRIAGLGFVSEADFFALGKMDDEWPFAMMGAHQRPVGLFRSLTMELAEEPTYHWLTLLEFGEHLVRSVRHERAQKVKSELLAELPTALAVCRRCRQVITGAHRCGGI